MKLILFILLFNCISIPFANEVPIDENMDKSAYDAFCAILTKSPIAVCKLINYKIDSIAPLFDKHFPLDTFYQYKFKVISFIIGKSDDSIICLHTLNGSIRFDKNEDWYIIVKNDRDEDYDNYNNLHIGYYEYTLKELISIINKIQKIDSKAVLNNKENQINKILIKFNCK